MRELTQRDLMLRSKYLSLVLRHKPQVAKIELDKNGWADIKEVCEKTDITREELQIIVDTNDKKRFTIEGDKIRAAQGHSVDVDLQLKEVIPPTILYHGTKEEFLIPIRKKGITKQNRTHVHLSDNRDTARAVADRRKGKSWILFINCKDMVKDEIKFYKSDNGVWLTEHVAPKYLIN